MATLPLTDDPTAVPRRLPSRLAFAAFAAIFALLALGYWLFLRPDYVAVFTQLRPADAAAVASQLDGRKLHYRLGDGGTAVLVPADRADEARLAVAGADAMVKGGVGFELFNKSDMGLTDFAQRINYQRALQGELERSIVMLDDVERARVHLALPERSLFRSERSSAKAAVELVAKPGRALDEARIAGVQRLVAFAVPDLAAADVVVLDGDGRVRSQSAEAEAALAPAAEERQAVVRYYQARARAALDQALPGVRAEVKALVIGGDAAGVAADLSKRNFRLRVLVATPAPLNNEEVALARAAVATAVALEPAAGDELSFTAGLGPDAGDASPAAPAAPRDFVAGPATVAPPASGWPGWLLPAAAVVLTLGLLLARWRATRPRLTAAERAAMVARLRTALRGSGAPHAG